MHISVQFLAKHTALKYTAALKTYCFKSKYTKVIQ